MTKENLRQVAISVFVAALAAFFSSLAQGLGDFIRANAVEVTSGGLGALVYLAKAYKA